MYAVAAGSPSQAWAVGYLQNGTRPRPLIAESTGGAFHPVKVSGLTNGIVTAVAASSPTNAWAVGYDYSGSGANSKTSSFVGYVKPRREGGTAATLLLSAIAAALTGVAIVTARLPGGQQRAALGRLLGVREKALAHAEGHAAIRQSESHNGPVLKSMLAGDAPDRRQRVMVWALARKLPDEVVDRLTTLAGRNDPDSILTLAAELCNNHNGRKFLKDLIKPIQSP